MSKPVSVEDEFESALQKYIVAVTEYKIAWNRYMMSVDDPWPVLDNAINRVCYADVSAGVSEPIKVMTLSQDEVDARALQASRVVDADGKRTMP